MRLSTKVSLTFREALQNDNFPLIKKSLLALYSELPQVLSEDLLQEDELNVDKKIITEMSDDVSTYTSLLECKNSWDYVTKKFFDLCDKQKIEIPFAEDEEKDSVELEENMKVKKTKNLNEALVDMKNNENMDEQEGTVISVTPTYAKAVRDHKEAEGEVGKMWKDMYKNAKKNGFKEPINEGAESFKADAKRSLSRLYNDWGHYFGDNESFIDEVVNILLSVCNTEDENLLTEDVEDDGAYSEDEIYDLLKSKQFTDNFTNEDGTVRTYYESEKDYTKNILKKYYDVVEVSDGRRSSDEDMCWVVAYSTPKINNN